MHTEKKNVPAFRVELYKGRHRKLWLVTLGFLMITFLWAGSTNSDLSAYEQAQGYTNLFFQLPIIGVKGFFLLLELCILPLQNGDVRELAADLRRL